MTSPGTSALVRESDAMHARVQAYQREALAGRPRESFDELALAIARFQARTVAPFRRLLDARGADLARATSADAIPAIPTDVFRLARVAAHPPDLDAVVFRTSGTTLGAGARGEHPFRRTDTYARGAVAWARRMLFFDRDDLEVLALAPAGRELSDSSLSFMIERFVEALGGRGSWHVHVSETAPGGGTVDVAGVARACQRARSTARPLLVAGTSFAFVHLADAAGSLDLRVPEGSRAMVTGGFKGRSREVSPEAMRALVARAFGLDPARGVVGEYGMTELSSQLYDGVLTGSGPAGVYVPPPWLRVSAVDPVTLEPVPDGDVGIARFVDLANVDSAVAVQTADRIRVRPHGIELLGRLPGDPPRGCALAMDEILTRS